MPRSRITIGFLLSFLVFSAFLQWWQVSAYPDLIWRIIILVLLLGFLLVIAEWRERVRCRFGALILAITIGCSVALVRVAQTTHVPSSESIDTFAVGERVEIIGTIVREPDRRPGKTKYTVDVDNRGLFLATDHAAWPPHAYGDRVRVRGILEKPGQIEQFHYDRYLSRYGIYSVMYRASVKTISAGHGNPILALLYSFKERFEHQLNRLYPEPHASFMAGLLTGSRRGIPEHLLTDFQTTGLTHIIAISGYNITIVIAVISSFLFFLPLKWRFLPSILAIAAFTLFVGASPAVVRAAIMGCLGLLALQVGRQQQTLISILFTAAAMVAWNPKVLWYDVGFQLSFLSVLGLVYLASFLDRICKPFPPILGIRESLQMTLAAQLAAVPLTILIFSHFSLVAPLANIVVAPLIPLAMLFGFLGVALSFIAFPLGLLFAFPGWGALELIIRATKFFAHLPHASVDVQTAESWIVWLYYGMFVGMIWLTFYHRYTKILGPTCPRGRMM